MLTRPLHEMEAKWQKRWEEEGVYRARDAVEDVVSKEKFYGLIEFPYPSGDGLHVGHPRSYTAIDIVTRKQRMEGKNVLYPIGWDAFGLPTENYAIKNKVKPADATKKNVATFTRQIKSLGFGFDWSREVDTTDPAYFKWTQWQFLQFFKHGMAYKATSTIHWCPRCKIGLANEEAQGGICERCGTVVEKREKEQWMIRITDYAQRLLTDLRGVDYLDRIKSQQVHWIGRSEGVEIVFRLLSVDGEERGEVRVFTTRPDTVFGVTYVVLAPEHPFVKREASNAHPRKEWDEVREYVENVDKKTDEERTGEDREKTGVCLPGVLALNPVNGERVPVWVADYVLPNYGTGAVMAVPAHDERDFAFAEKYGLPTRQVVSLDGYAINSDFLNGAPTWKAKEDAVTWVEDHRCGAKKVTYRLRDWVFSRQRYWGEPIPLVYCDSCAKKKQKALIIHALGSSAESHWYPELVRALEAEGFEVSAPNLPEPLAPTYEGWMSVLRPILDQLGESDVIVGHSLGGLMAVHAVSEMDRKIGHLYLVAPLIGPVADEEWAQKQAQKPDRDYGAVRKIWERPVDWKGVTDLVGSVNVLVSDDDLRVPKQSHAFLPEGWYIKSLGVRGHFWQANQPEIVREVLGSKNTGWVPLSDDQLPLMLPDVAAYEPTDTGESPLAKIESWVKTTCPRCGNVARRETDTMPNWAGSSWYFLRYCDPKNAEALASKEALKYWMPVDLYNGGMEHTTLHLLYSRFWYKFLWDLGVVPQECGSEPYKMRRSHNMILGEGGVKMSKSKGNVVNPDDVVAKYGADVFRVYEMFIGPYDQPAPWDTNGIEGVRRFLDRVWGLFMEPRMHGVKGRESDASSLTLRDLTTLYQQTVKKVTEGIDGLQFNTCVSQLMILTNAFQTIGHVPETMVEGYVKMLAPFAPHLADEIWCEVLGHTMSMNACGAGWPTFDVAKLQAATFELVVQVNGRVRDKIVVASDISEEEARQVALASAIVAKWMDGKVPAQVVYVKGRLVSIVV